MANALYTKAREKFLSGSLNLPADTIKAALVKSAYAPNLATDEFYSTISANVLGTPQALATKSVTGGKFDADDVTFSAVASGDTAGYVVIYKDTGVAGTSPLIAVYDTAAGLPVLTNGGNITITWDNGTNKILAI